MLLSGEPCRRLYKKWLPPPAIGKPKKAISRTPPEPRPVLYHILPKTYSLLTRKTG